MATFVASAQPADGELSLLRLYVLRAIYALIAFAEGSIVLQRSEPDALGCRR